MNSLHVLITGGHLTPALGFIDYIQAHHPETKLTFIGRKYARRNTKQPAKEKEACQEKNVPFVSFDSGKLAQGSIVTKFFELIRTAGAFFTALKHLRKIKPDCVVSFGSYLAVPVAYAAWVLRIPVITHEQTRTSGFATQVISMVAHTVALTFAETSKLLPRANTVFTGNILRTQVLQKNHTAPKWFETASTKPLVYITGGSQGSEVINAVVGQALWDLTKEWTVIHQCGAPSQSRNYFRELTLQAQQLPEARQKRYFVQPWISESELAWIYTKAAVVVSRAGANTVQELSARGIPSVFIPLPFSHRQEQLKNAEALTKKRRALMLHQKDLTAETLCNVIASAYARRHELKENLKSLKLKTDAAAQLFSLVLKATG